MQIYANAPVDRLARSENDALDDSVKRGAPVFFGKGKCASCHAVGGESNEMVSDFKTHNIGVPQIAPFFGVGKGNAIFDGPQENEGLGLEQITGNSRDRYKFRSSPLRNAALQPAFFHNGAFTKLEDAITSMGRTPRATTTQFEPESRCLSGTYAEHRGPVIGTTGPTEKPGSERSGKLCPRWTSR